MLAPLERLIFRQLLDDPDYTALVSTHLLPEHFSNQTAEYLYQIFLRYYQRDNKHLIPSLAILHLGVDAHKKLSEHEARACDEALKDLATMPPNSREQGPFLLQETEEFIRKGALRQGQLALIHAETAKARQTAIAAITAANAFSFHLPGQGRYKFLSLATLRARPDTSFLVQDLIVEGSFVGLVSKPGLYKTYCALDLACAVATDHPTFLGHRVNGHGPVVYVAGEGQSMIKWRIQAWQDHHQIPGDLPNFFMIDSAVPLADLGAARQFLTEVTPLKPRLIVFDTLSRCMAGADENSQRDMSAIVELVDALRQTLGCTVLILHHENAAGTRERGSTVLKGALDTLMKIKPDQTRLKYFSIVCDKQKDCEEFLPINMMTHPVTLAACDRYTGEPLTNIVLRLTTEFDDMKGASASVRQVLALQGQGLSRTAIAKELGGRKRDQLAHLRGLEATGVVNFKKKPVVH